MPHFTLIIRMCCNSDMVTVTECWGYERVKLHFNSPTCLHGMDRDNFTFTSRGVCVCVFSNNVMNNLLTW